MPPGARSMTTSLGAIRTWRTGAASARAGTFLPRFLRVQTGERAALGGQAGQQRGRFPEFAELLPERTHALVNGFQTNGIGVPHGAAAVSGKTIAGEVDGIDIGGTQGITFFEDARAFVDHGINAALENFAVRDPALGNARCRGGFPDEVFNAGIGDGFALLIVAIPAAGGFLAEPAHFDELIDDERLADAGLFEVLVLLADAPADIDAGP